MRRTIKTEFFTTISFKHFIYSILFKTIWLNKILNWKYINQYENSIKKYLGLFDSKTISFYNARSWIYQLLNNLKTNNKNEVIISWYNCVSVVNSIIQAWLKPIYCDINKDDLWLDIYDLENKINKNTLIIIIQHTFWKTSQINKIKEIWNKYNIPVLEDCAHSLWSRVDNKYHWSFWDFSIFSSWRDKVISWVNWWVLLINNNNYDYLVNDIKKWLVDIDKKTINKNLNYNILAYISSKTYDFLWLWKVIIYYSRKLWFINEILDDKEKKCENEELGYRLPNSLAFLALKDLEKIDLYTMKKRYISKLYDKKIDNKYIKKLIKENYNEELNYFRYPIFIENNLVWEFVKFFRSNNVIIWTSWSWTNIAPITTDIKSCNYIKSHCKNAELISKNIVFLPNHKFMDDEDVEKIISLTNKFKNV